jgi:hypothetical protein
VSRQRTLARIALHLGCAITIGVLAVTAMSNVASANSVGIEPHPFWAPLVKHSQPSGAAAVNSGKLTPSTVTPATVTPEQIGSSKLSGVRG